MGDLATVLNNEYGAASYIEAFDALRERTEINGESVEVKEFPNLQMKDLVAIREPEAIGVSEVITQYNAVSGAWARIGVEVTTAPPVETYLEVWVSSSADDITYTDYALRRGFYSIEKAALHIERLPGEFLYEYNKIKICSPDYTMAFTVAVAVG
jgi:hypothetical protein